ncbi:hypothetical protein CCACVL1_24456, partial [Corchorus capsularis]
VLILVSGVAEDSATVKIEGLGCVLCLETEDMEVVVGKAVLQRWGRLEGG